MNCNHCGGSIPQGASFCPFCGQRAQMPEPALPDPITIEVEQSPQDPSEGAAAGAPQTAPGMTPERQEATAPIFAMQPADAPSAYGPLTVARKRRFPVWLAAVLGGAFVIAIAVLLILPNDKKASSQASAPANTASATAKPNTDAQAPSADAQAPAAEQLPPVNSDKFSWPVPGAGETLYIGTAQFDEARRFYVAFILTADGKSIHDMTLRAEDVATKTPTMTITGLTVCEQYSASYDAEQAAGELTLGNSSLSGLQFTDGGASATVKYVYTHRGVGTSATSTEIDFGSSPVAFTAYEGDIAASAPSPQAAAETSAPQQEEYDGVSGLFMALCNKSSAEEYNDEMIRGKTYLAAYDLSDEWDALCRDVSAYLDALENKPLLEAMAQYDIEDADWQAVSEDFAKVQPRLEGGGPINESLREAIYTPGCTIDLPAVVWRQAKLKEYLGVSGRKLPLDPQNPRPMTAVLIDKSETIAVGNSKEGFYDVSDQYAGSITTRAKKVASAIVKQSGDKIAFAADPDSADIIIEMTVTYPLKGTYTAGTAKAKVYGCAVELTAYRAGSAGKKITCSAKNMPGNTVRGSGTKIWMSVPDLPTYDDFKEFMEKMDDWFE